MIEWLKNVWRWLTTELPSQPEWWDDISPEERAELDRAEDVNF